MNETIGVRNPRNGMIDDWITPPFPQQLAEICQNLRPAQRDWQRTEIEQRITTLQQWKQVLLSHKTDLIKTLAMNILWINWFKKRIVYR